MSFCGAPSCSSPVPGLPVDVRQTRSPGARRALGSVSAETCTGQSIPSTSAAPTPWAGRSSVATTATRAPAISTIATIAARLACAPTWVSETHLRRLAPVRYAARATAGSAPAVRAPARRRRRKSRPARQKSLAALQTRRASKNAGRAEPRGACLERILRLFCARATETSRRNRLRSGASGPAAATSVTSPARSSPSGSARNRDGIRRRRSPCTCPTAPRPSDPSCTSDPVRTCTAHVFRSGAARFRCWWSPATAARRSVASHSRRVPRRARTSSPRIQTVERAP